MIELYLTDFHTGWQLFLLKRLPYHLFDSFDFLHLTFWQNYHRNSRFTGTTCTPTAVVVGFYFIGQLVVNYVGDIVYINTAGSDIGSNEHLYLACAERFHYQIALILTQIAVKSSSIVAVFNEFFGYCLCIAFGAAKHYREDIGVSISEAF